jgi:hypothetical protein
LPKKLVRVGRIPFEETQRVNGGGHELRVAANNNPIAHVLGTNESAHNLKHNLGPPDEGGDHPCNTVGRLTACG